MTKHDGDNGGYEVGYGRTPVSTRFKKGQSGNPRGRPPASRNVATIIREVLFRKVKITEDGKTRRVPAVQAVLLRQLKEALAGDHRSTTNLLRIATQLRDMEAQDAVANEAGDRGSPVLDEVDLDVLQEFADLVRNGGFDNDTPEGET